MRYTVLFFAVVALLNASHAAPLRGNQLVSFDQVRNQAQQVGVVRRNENENEEDEDEPDEDGPPSKPKKEISIIPAIPAPAASAAPGVTDNAITGAAAAPPPPPPAAAAAAAAGGDPTAPTKSPLQSLTDATATLTTASNGAAQGISNVATGITSPQGLSNIGATTNGVATIAAAFATENGVGAIAGSAAASPVNPVSAILNPQ